jgi:hypothetical protein
MPDNSVTSRPPGRPLGSRNTRTVFVEQLFTEDTDNGD